MIITKFIIASRAYFQQSPTCTRVNNLVKHLTPIAFRCYSYALHVVNFINGSDMFMSMCICISLRLHASLILE